MAATLTLTSTTTLDREVDAQQQRDFSAGWSHGFTGVQPETLNAKIAPHYVRGYRAGRLTVMG